MNKFEEIEKSYLYNLISKSRNILAKEEYIYIEFSKIFNRIDEISQKPLKLAVLGEFSSGKSTFINRLIGMDILPTGIIPVTSTVTTLEYGETEKIEVSYCSHDGSKVTKEYEGYGKLLDLQKSKQENTDLLSVTAINVFIKNDILRYFHIIDTPGFNDSENMSISTEAIFKDINYVIWLFNATQAGKNTEKEYLEKLCENSFYKNNIYAILNYGDAIVNDEMQYQNIAGTLLEDANFKSIFTNKQPFLISSLKRDKFWNQKFNSLEEELREHVLKKDKEISENQLHQEKNNLINQLMIIKESNSNLLEEINSNISDFIDKIIYSNSNADILKNELLKIIRDGIEYVETKLKNSSIYEKKETSLLKFSAFYATAEELEKMQKNLENKYKNYIENLNKYFEEFKETIKITRKNHDSLNKKFDNLIDKRFDEISSNLKVLQNSKKLLIVGYIIGVFSDDYIYNLLEKKINAVESLSEDTINSLLKMDLDVSYILEEILNIKSEIEQEIKNDLYIIDKTLKQIEG